MVDWMHIEWNTAPVTLYEIRIGNETSSVRVDFMNAAQLARLRMCNSGAYLFNSNFKGTVYVLRKKKNNT